MENLDESDFLCGLDNEIDFQKLTVHKILDEQQVSNQITLLTQFEDFHGYAILIIKKAPLVVDKIKKDFNFNTKVYNKWRNDIYGKFNIILPSLLSEAYLTIIYPVDEKLIRKHSAKTFYIFQETFAFYSEFALPNVIKSQLGIKWVYNILEGKAEQENVIFKSKDRNPQLDFILSYDMKWNGKDKNIYLLALPLLHGIKSIRDLDQSHLPLLKSFLTCNKVISQKYDVPEHAIKAYFHYPPSFYHLHVHFTLTTNMNDVPDYLGFGRNHFLSDVIQNIEMRNNFYQTRTIPVYVDDKSPLFEDYVKNC